MALTITHAKVSAVSDDPTDSANGVVLPSDWNDNHQLSGTLSNANLADMADSTIKGRAVGSGAGAPSDLVANDVRTILGNPTTTTDNAIVRFNGTAGSTQNSTVTVDDTGIISGATIDTGNSNTIKANGNTITASAGTATVTIQNVTDTLVGRATTDTLTNKTIDTAGTNTLKVNGNTLAASAGTATLTFQNSSDTIVGRATTDTLTNKTISGSSNTLSNIATSSLATKSGTGGTVVTVNTVGTAGDIAIWSAAGTGNIGGSGANGSLLGPPLAIQLSYSGTVGSGELRTDNSTFASITTVAFSSTDGNGNSISSILSLIVPGTVVTIYRSTGTNFGQFTISNTGSSITTGKAFTVINPTGSGFTNGHTYYLHFTFPRKGWIPIVLSDEGVDATAATGVWTIPYMPDFYITKVVLACTTAPTGSVAQADFNIGGTSIFSTNPTIDASETSSETAATASVLSTKLIAAGSVGRADLDQVGSSVKGQGYKLFLIGYYL